MKSALRVAGSALTLVLLAACADTGEVAESGEEQPPTSGDAAAAPAPDQQVAGPDTRIGRS